MATVDQRRRIDGGSKKGKEKKEREDVDEEEKKWMAASSLDISRGNRSRGREIRMQWCGSDRKVKRYSSACVLYELALSRSLAQRRARVVYAPSSGRYYDDDCIKSSFSLLFASGTHIDTKSDTTYGHDRMFRVYKYAAAGARRKSWHSSPFSPKTCSAVEL